MINEIHERRNCLPDDFTEILEIDANKSGFHADS